MKIKLFPLILVVVLVCVTITACGGDSKTDNTITDKNPGSDGQQNENGSPDSPDTGDKEYIYPDINGGGKNFVILAPTNNWYFYHDVVFDEPPAEVLDTAIYNRNKFVENQFNINIVAKQVDMTAAPAELRKNVISGTDVFDMAFLPPSVNSGGKQIYIGGSIVEGYFYNLNELPYLNLDKPWWNQVMREEALIKNQLFYGGNDINISTLQGASCVYFNKKMMEDLGLELPYEMVRAGKWTFDELQKYIKAGANINSETMWNARPSSTAVFGLASHEFSANALLAGAGEKYITMDADGYPQVAFEGQRFVDVLEKIQGMVTKLGDYVHGNNPGFDEDAAQIFYREKSLLLLTELHAATNILRAMENDYGIVPIPKYEENQKNYYNLRAHYATVVTVIPQNTADPDFASAVVDALAYKSYKDVTPVFFDLSVSHKGLRDEDSIEMLQIIRDSGSFDIGLAYGWSLDLYMGIAYTLGCGKSFKAASQIEKMKPGIVIKIEQTMDLFD